MLLAEDPEQLDKQFEDTLDRLGKHYENEKKRREAGLKTDMQRLEDGERIND